MKAQQPDKKQRGATMVEYVLLLALIAILAIGALTDVGLDGLSTFETVSSAL